MVTVETGAVMDKAEVKEEIIELETIQIALDDKLHRVEETCTRISAVLDNTQVRIDRLKEEIN